MTVVNNEFDHGMISAMIRPMNKPLQKRAIATREKLLRTAKGLIDKDGFDALRVEDIVKSAGVAKGTFFAHFSDKDRLLEQIIGARLEKILDEMAANPAPNTPQEFTEALAPLISFMTSERCVFDVILRHSGAAAIADIGPIAHHLMRQIEVFTPWCDSGAFRKDVAPEILAEGIQGFAFQAMGLAFCAVSREVAILDRLGSYLSAWLVVGEPA